MKKFLSALALVASFTFTTSAATVTFDLNISKKQFPIQSTMYGIFFEDINFGADGGLYAEMIKNRSFEFNNPLQGWQTAGDVKVMNDGPFARNPHYIRLSYPGHRVMSTAIENEGFFGISFKQGEQYRFTVWARTATEGCSSISVQLIDPSHDENFQAACSQSVTISNPEWKKYEIIITPSFSCENGKLRIFLRGANGEKPETAHDVCSIDLEHISLFPVKTWKNRPGGMRADLAQALCDLKPGIFRFPGGCIVEGTNLSDRYQWKNTVGPVENRPYNLNRWQFEFDYRFFPDYCQSYGLGFFEYMQLCEDFNAEALPVLNCGMTCQYENPEHMDATANVAVGDLDPYIQDAIDLVEFANGDTTTTWGKLRAQMGHPEPFGLKYIAIGNEQWDYKDNPAYTKRLQRFVSVLRTKCPEIRIIGSTGASPEGDSFDMLQPRMKQLGVDLYDEHFYRNEQWFLTHALRYDTYDRKGPKVFAGEYACHGAGNYPDGKEKKCNHFATALYEAAMMTGFERNADVVHMCTYAPLLAHVKGWQWKPDLIWFDNNRVMRTCSYYVQQLYSQYRGTHVLPLSMNKQPIAGQHGQNGLFATACFDSTRNAIILKIANTSAETQNIHLNLSGTKKDIAKAFTRAEVITLHSDNPDAENTLDAPNQIVPHKSTISKDVTDLSIPQNTFQVYVFYR